MIIDIGERFVATADIRAAIKGRETDLLDALGVLWRDGRPHINCPYPDHSDKNPSWRWDERKRRAICTCGSDPILNVLMKIEAINFQDAKLRAAELLNRNDLIIQRYRNKRQREGQVLSPNQASKSATAAGCRLSEYAEAKKLPIEFLRSLGVSEIANYQGAPAVRIPYFAADGTEPAVRFRIALNGKVRFRWRKGSRPCLYGAHWAARFSDAGYVVIVEGESDAQTLCLHEFPALGLPGAGNWNENRDAALLPGVPVIYVIVEPDKGGDAVKAWLARSSIAPRARLVRMPPETKDPSSLYLANPAGFREAFQRALDAAEPFQAAPSQPPPRADGRLNDRPELLVDDSDLTRTARDLRDLLACGDQLFDRGTPVKLARDGMTSSMSARPLTVESVVHEAHRVGRPIKLVENKDGMIMEVPVTLPDRVARLYLDMEGEWNLRVLNGITTAPILGADGSIFGRNGYDRGTGLWCDAVEIAPMTPMPPMTLAAAALKRLRTTFRTFPFADAPRVWDAILGVEVVDIDRPPGRDESAFLVGLLTAVCRPSLWLAPGLLLVAPQLSGAGTGKGLLARAICIIAFGQAPQAFTVGHDSEELEKRISAALIEASFALFLDNVNNTALRSATLASAITERPTQVRDFGKLRMLLLSSTAFVVVTGNALTVAEDLARRFITAELDAKMEDPEERPFPPGFLKSIGERRTELLADVLAIWRWGRQNLDALKRGRPLGSFETWCEWVRDPLLTLGCADPVERISEVKGKDQRRGRAVEILSTWWDRHRSSPVKASEIDEAVRALIDPQSRGRQFVAAAVEKMVGTRVGGLTLTVQRGDGKWAVATYAVCETTADSTGGHLEHRGHRGHRGADDPPDVPASIHSVCEDPELDPMATDDGVPPNGEAVL